MGNGNASPSCIKEGCGEWKCIPILHTGGMWGMGTYPHPAYSRRDVGNGNASPFCMLEVCGKWEHILHTGGMSGMGMHPRPACRRDIGNGNASPSCTQEGCGEWIPILHAGGIWEMGMHPLAELPVIKNCAVFLTLETVLAPPNFVLKSAFS